MEQKLSVVVLGMCGIFAISLSLYRIRENVRAPFLVDKTQLLAAKDIIGLSTAEEQAKLQRMDTDGDGLSDFDETNVFSTNPNLRDTCGDGVPDNIRITTGKNLNCAGQRMNPTGQLDTSQALFTTSSVTGLPTNQTAPGSGVNFGQIFQAAGSGSVGQGMPAAPPTDITQVMPRDPTKIRESLRGLVDVNKLQSISDQELLAMYDTSMQQMQRQSQTTSTSSTTP